ncbi:MAG: hypothetical protein ACKO3V_15580 [Pirellula sp.]
MVLRPQHWFLALSCLVTLTPGLFAGVLLDLESVPIGTVLNNGVGRFQHTNNKHKNPDAFLTTQDDEDDDKFVAAFNGSSADAGNPEAIFGGGKTHTIVLGDIPTTTDGFFWVFLFDANQNQSNSDNHIDITMLQVFTSNSNSLTSISQLGTSATMVYDMDDFDDFTVRVDGSVGTGGADMYLYLPNSVFVAVGATSSTNVYLYYQYTYFNDGAEAWLLDKKFTYTNPEVPETASMALWATSGLVGLVYRARRKASCSRSRNA